MTVDRELQRFTGRILGAGLLATTAAIHLDLYLTGYKTIPTIGWLFLLQIIAAFALTAAVLASRIRIATASAALFCLATLGGYVLSIWVGLFGFREVRTSAGVTVGIIEILAIGVLGLLAVSVDKTEVVASRQQGGSWHTPSPFLIRIAVLPATVIAAAAVLGSALATAHGAPNEAKGTFVEIKAAHIEGSELLTNQKGFTLYLFGADTSTSSHCYGACAIYWPPVLGRPTAGPGVTGRLGTIRRSDGSHQVTYDGHPLYTYIADGAPGQARGNVIDLNGGYWYAVTVAGGRA